MRHRRGVVCERPRTDEDRASQTLIGAVILPRSLLPPLASTDGSLTRNLNRTGVRLWTESLASMWRASALHLFDPDQTSTVWAAYLFLARPVEVSPFDRAIFGRDSGGTMVMFGT